jgi:hypothetical protein
MSPVPPARGLLLLLLLLAGSTLTACDDDEGGGDGSGGDGSGGEGEGEGEGEGFVDHTVPRIDDVPAFDTLAAAGPSSSALKLVITRFGRGDERVRFLDSRFYALHDQYYWFRLLNGAPIDGLPDAPVTTSHGPFPTIDAVTTWARAEEAAGRALPLDLRFVEGDRLYSPRFYDLALFVPPRQLGAATLLRFPAIDAEHPERWALELEFRDTPSVDELRTFLRVTAAALPADIAARLVWITRSQAQEQLAATLPADLRDRVLSYADVVVPGAVEVYAEGTTAGRVVVVRRGQEDRLRSTRATDVLVVEDVPDFLPACAALLTTQPQTALAHVNLLARNRGIPNAFLAGAVDDPQLDQLARVRAPAIVSARRGVDGASDAVVVRTLSEDDFATWQSLTAPPPTAVPPVDLENVAATVDLALLSFADVDAWRPVLGGKAAGLLALQEAGVTTVDRPLAVSIAPFVEHLQTTGLAARLPDMLAHPTFLASPAVRRLVLDGPAAVDPALLSSFLAAHPPGTALRDLVDLGGVQGLILQTPVAPDTLAAITGAVDDHFGRYADDQALRFRSSSNVEDAEGFNGAGLYTSNAAFVRPAPGQPDVEDALRATWASYWGSEAFEERALARVDHLSGAMGVVVHANFPDDVERSNGVATFTVLPAGTQDAGAAAGGFVLEVNQQHGAWSVTNPPPDSPHLPEIDRVVLLPGDDAPRIERVRSSTLVPAGVFVLDDDDLRAMFDDARAVTGRWLAVANAALPASQRRSTLTLDLETRVVEAGWPALRSGLRLPGRLVWKQARTLEPAAARVPAAIAAQPIPRDVLARARRIERRTCAGAAVTIGTTEVLTDDALVPAMGFGREPFTAFVVVTFAVDVPALGIAAGTRRSAVHTAFAAVLHPVIDDQRWSVVVDVAADRRAALGLDRVVVEADGHVVVEVAGVVVEDAATCARDVAFAAPADFLAALLEKAPGER